MTTKNLTFSFCDLIIIDDYLVEVIPHEGVEFGEKELKEYHDFYNQLKSPVGVLVNRKHSYSYSFNAQMNITKNINISAVAFLIEDISKYNKAKLVMMAIKGDTPIKLFSDRVTALDWLKRYSNKTYVENKENH